MKHLITLGFMLIIGVSSFAQKRKAEQDTKNWRYEIEGIGEGKEGTYLVKVWSYNKKDKIAVEQAKKNAVHGIVFQGFTGSGKVSSQPPLVTDPDIKIAKADFFDAFLN